MSSALSFTDLYFSSLLSQLDGNPDLETIASVRNTYEEMPQERRRECRQLGQRIDELFGLVQPKITALIETLEAVDEHTDFFSITTVIPTIRTLKKIENIQMNDAKRRQAVAVAKINEVVHTRIEDVMETVVSAASKATTLADVKVVEDHNTRLMEITLYFQECLGGKMEALQLDFKEIARKVEGVVQADAETCAKELEGLEKAVKKLKPEKFKIPKALQDLVARVAALSEFASYSAKCGEITRLKTILQTYIRENLTLRDQELDALTIHDIPKVIIFIKDLTSFYKAASKIMDHDSTQLLTGMIATLKTWGQTIREERGLKK